MPDKSAHKSHGHEHHRRRLSSPALYINREVSQVAFIRRVLAEAQSERHPLLERVKFVAFVGSQVDEFVMVRMAGLQDQLEAGVREGGPDGIPPALLLAELQSVRSFRAVFKAAWSMKNHGSSLKHIE